MKQLHLIFVTWLAQVSQGGALVLPFILYVRAALPPRNVHLSKAAGRRSLEQAVLPSPSPSTVTQASVHVRPSKNNKVSSILATTANNGDNRDADATANVVPADIPTDTTASEQSNDDAASLSDTIPSMRGGGQDEELLKKIKTTATATPEANVLGRMPEIPTLLQYFKFALPCLGLWIAGPSLSLVDTCFVGLSGSPDLSAKRLAALGPATTFMDGATYLFAFLNVATTNLYSTARASPANLVSLPTTDGKEPRKEPVNLAAESVVRTAAIVSLKCGFGIMILLLAVCQPLLHLYIGPAAVRTTPELLSSATAYVRIRALSMPTSLLLGVLQAALLGAKDSVTPLIAIVYSTVINVVGDYLLVNRLNMGLTGAALATTAAQWASTAALMVPARRKLVHDHHLGIVGRRQPVDKAPQAVSRRRKLWGNKNTDNTSNNNGVVTPQSFLSFAAPVLTLILGKLAAFGFMTNAAAGVPGQPTPLASHQIILSLLFFCSPFLEVISQTAQTFLPPFLAPIRSYMEQQEQASKQNGNQPRRQSSHGMDVLKPWEQAAKEVSTSLLGLGFLAATVIASVVSLIPAYFGWFLTSDTTVQRAVQPLAKYLWLGAFAWAPVAVGEGVLLARRQLGFLAVVYLLSTAMLPPALLVIKLRQGSVGQVWLLFGLFQIFRALCFTGRIWWGPFLMNRLFSRNNTQKNPNTATS